MCPNVVNITIIRDTETDQATFGTMTIGSLQLFTLEPPDRNNANTNNWQTAGRILPGTYQAFTRTDGPKGWRIELKNVIGREQIEIHSGNFPRDTSGCILPGTSRGDNQVNDSRNAMDKIRQAIDRVGQGATILVAIA